MLHPLLEVQGDTMIECVIIHLILNHWYNENIDSTTNKSNSLYSPLKKDLKKTWKLTSKEFRQPINKLHLLSECYIAFFPFEKESNRGAQVKLNGFNILPPSFFSPWKLEAEELYIIPSHWDYIKQQEVHYKYSSLHLKEVNDNFLTSILLLFRLEINNGSIKLLNFLATSTTHV